VLMLHFRGQMTCERITSLLNDAGVSISKRQVVRLLTAKLGVFAAEETAVFEAGLKTSPYITVDDTGTRHAGKAAYTTQIGSARFTAFRTSAHKSRLAFLHHLLGGAARFEVNAAALAYMRAVGVAPSLIEALQRCAPCSFLDERAWSAHLDGLGLPLKRGGVVDPYRLASEAALWGAIRAQGRLEGTVIVSDEAGQFRVGDHALCWVHAERLVQKLIPANALQENAIEVFKRMVWWFYGRLKTFKAAPSPQMAAELCDVFDRIFLRRTRYQGLSALLKRLAARKAELLRVLQHPEIPLNTNASENDIRTVVIKRKISGGTVSEKGRSARDVMLGLAKTCAKLRLSFFDYLGGRLGLPAPHIPPLETLIRSVQP
jgi:transposase IS66 family protein